MELLEHDIEISKKVMSGEWEPALYAFANENQKGISRVMQWEGQDALIVASGGDTYLSAVYGNAKDIVLFDICPLAKRFTYLKIAAFCTLDFDDFFLFMVPFIGKMVNPHFLSLDIFSVVKGVLDDETRTYWEWALKKDRTEIYALFSFEEDCSEDITYVQKNRPYFQTRENYQKLQDLVRKRMMPVFYTKDFLDMEEIPGVFGRIYLSNIINTFVLELETASMQYTYMEYYTRKMKQAAKRKLTSNGIMGVNYMRFDSKLSKQEKSRCCFKDPTIHCSGFEGFYDKHTDYLLTYHKK